MTSFITPGNDFDPSKLNIWGGDFPRGNDLVDGFETLAPIKTFPPNEYGVSGMLGNVWEWVAGGKGPDKRILRGGSFIDSKDGLFNHMVLVSTRQLNSGDSAGSNIGFRCARSVIESGDKDAIERTAGHRDDNNDHIEL